MRAGGAARVRYRPGIPADAPALAAAMRASIRGLARGATRREIALWSSLPPLYHAWAMTAGGERYLVAERGGRVAGYAALRGAEVTAVFARPGEARRGVGRALLARVERAARAAGVKVLSARAAAGAVGFYERCGWRRGREVRVPLFGRARLRAYRVTKRLSREGKERRSRVAAKRLV